MTNDQFRNLIDCPGDDCWPWPGAVSNGYGIVKLSGGRHMKPERAHRFSWLLFRGSIPTGKELHHSCGNKLCVNPWHLFAVTKREHPGAGPDVGRTKTHCVKGHEFSTANTKIRKRNGYTCRVCKKCHNERVAERNRRKLAEKQQKLTGANKRRSEATKLQIKDQQRDHTGRFLPTGF